MLSACCCAGPTQGDRCGRCEGAVWQVGDHQGERCWACWGSAAGGVQSGSLQLRQPARWAWCSMLQRQQQEGGTHLLAQAFHLCLHGCKARRLGAAGPAPPWPAHTHPQLPHALQVLTGDNLPVARKVCQEVGIPTAHMLTGACMGSPPPPGTLGSAAGEGRVGCLPASRCALFGRAGQGLGLTWKVGGAALPAKAHAHTRTHHCFCPHARTAALARMLELLLLPACDTHCSTC